MWMNRMTVMLERLYVGLLRIQAAGYPSKRHSNVVMTAISIEYTKV